MEDLIHSRLDDQPATAASLPVELAIVIPTLNERENVPILVDRLTAVLAGIRWEAIFVDDDSPDGTADVVRGLGQRRGEIRCVQRVGRRGLASACIEGILSSSAPYIAIMDADLQHDEALLPRMLATIKQRRLDIVVASRYLANGSVGEWQRSRVLLSGVANRLGRLVVKAELTDPMSGFFLIERGAFSAAMRGLSGRGFKILLDIFASSPQPLAFAELPFRFRRRINGESKLDGLVAWDYLTLLLDKLVGHIIPVRFLSFAMVGGIGAVAHLAVLWLALHALGLAFPIAQAIAAMTAMSGNFLLNNTFTYRDRRLHGGALAAGLLSFYAICAIGAGANIAVASHLFAADHSWWLAGLAGAAIGSVWNYAASSAFTWRSRSTASPAPRSPAVTGPSGPRPSAA